MQTPIASERTVKAIGDLAAEAGIGRVHMLAWRDLDDPEAGGSEVHAHNVASIWAQSGIEVLHRTSYAPGHPQKTTRNGYQVVRKAGRYLVFPRSVASEIAHRHGRCDALVEIWNGMPFMSPTWFRGPKSVWFHHVHGPMWEMTLPKNLARAGKTLEEIVAPKFYRRCEIVTLSSSSHAELVDQLGFDQSRIHVVPPGVSPSFGPGGQKANVPTIVAVGRLVPVKNFDRLIKIAARVKAVVADLRLIIVGEGYERPNLERLVRDLNAESWVTLAGKVSDDEITDLYRSSWVLGSTSIREGWGMTLTEAAACGTPSVASAISGHQDAARDGESGILCEGDDQFVEAFVAMLTDDERRKRFELAALDRASELTWDATAIGTMQVLARDALARRSQRR